MKKITFLAFASWLLVACGGEKKPAETDQPNATKTEVTTPPKTDTSGFAKAKVTKGAKKLAAQNNQFALNFYAKLKNEPKEQGKNLFFSPFSLHTALGMLYLGTSNAGKEELAKVLGIQDSAKVGKDFIFS